MSGDCQRKMVDSSSDKRATIQAAHELYQKAATINNELAIEPLSKTIAQKMNELSVQSKANGITL